jgi:hypothetical protein
MFWDSVLAGLKVLTYWETYVAGLEYLAIFFIPMAIVRMIMEKSEGGGAAVGCLSMLLLPVLNGAATAVFLLTLSPIIFGFAEDAAWSFPWRILVMAPGAFFKFVGVLVVAAIVLAIIPILGKLDTLYILVNGGIALGLILGILDTVNPGIVKGSVDFIPGFWFFVGLLVIGGVMRRVGMLVAALIATGLDKAKEGIGQLVMVPLVNIFGFVPVFMYGAWLGSQVKGGF